MFFKIYLVGLAFLVGALLVNLAAKFLKLPSWYDFLLSPKLNVPSFVWLFVVYPFILGALVFFFRKFF